MTDNSYNLSQMHTPLLRSTHSALASMRGGVVELAPPATVAASELERGLEEVVAAVRSTVA